MKSFFLMVLIGSLLPTTLFSFTEIDDADIDMVDTEEVVITRYFSSPEIAEHCLIFICKPLIDKQSPSMKTIALVFQEIRKLVNTYPRYYYSLMGSVIDILRNLPPRCYVVMRIVLDNIAGREDFLCDVLTELKKYELMV